MSINIVQVRPADLSNLVMISRKVFHNAFDHLNTPENMKEYMDRAFNKEQLLSEIENPYSEFYFISVDDDIAGYLKINQGPAQSDIRDQESLEIERIYVYQDIQSKGLGTLLMDKAITRARELGLTYIWLGVWEKNPNAIRFYERHGFHVFGKHSFKMGDDLQTDLLMKREIK
jgi:ribosomal protein S18 acetylase RimI-like enzyme